MITRITKTSLKISVFLLVLILPFLLLPIFALGSADGNFSSQSGLSLHNSQEQTTRQYPENRRLLAQGLVVCDGPDDCDYEALIEQVNVLINWLIGFLTAAATLLFAYAGFLYLTSGGNESQAQQGKKIFANVAIGFAIVLVAFLIVKAVVTILTNENWQDDWQDAIPILFSVEDLELDNPTLS